MNKNSVLFINEVFISLCQRDNLKDRALDHMMLGALEVKKEDILKVVGQNINTYSIIKYNILIIHSLKDTTVIK